MDKKMGSAAVETFKKVPRLIHQDFHTSFPAFNQKRATQKNWNVGFGFANGRQPGKTRYQNIEIIKILNRGRVQHSAETLGELVLSFESKRRTDEFAMNLHKSSTNSIFLGGQAATNVFRRYILKVHSIPAHSRIFYVTPHEDSYQ